MVNSFNNKFSEELLMKFSKNDVNTLKKMKLNLKCKIHFIHVKII